MSYCELLGFGTNGFEAIETFKNAHGFAYFIWDALFDRYIEKEFKYDNCMRKPERVWNLVESNIFQCEKYVLMSTFDYALLENKWIDEFAQNIDAFMDIHKSGDRICHLPAMRQAIIGNKDKYSFIGWYGMSCGENPWYDYDLETGNQHFFIGGATDNPRPYKGE